MTDPIDKDNVPPPRRMKRKRWLPSLIWLVPIVALVVGGTLMARVILARGAQITVTFSSAEGIEAGKTRVKYKSVDIGVVKSIGLTDDRSGAVALIELTHDGKAFAVSDARFWVVRPRVAAGSVSGLGTLLSGAYIGVDGAPTTGNPRSRGWTRRPPSTPTPLASNSRCMRQISARSISVRRCTSAACV